MNEKFIRDFTRENLSILDKNGKRQLCYSNLITFILKISGLELENLEDIEFDEDNCSDFKLIDDIINNSKIRDDIFTNNKLYTIFDIICSDTYNKYFMD